LLDPRVGFDALALDGDPTYPPDITLAPVAGILMLWPGYLRCCSRVHLAREPWVRVALRIELDGKPKAGRSERATHGVQRSMADLSRASPACRQ
jgi:hypothetical protein